jgi:hypothetical protein
MEWMSEGRRRAADFSVALPAAEAARRLRTALDPEGDWVAHVLRDAHARLERLRAGAHADAGGLVIAIDKEHAERLADRLGRIDGERPAVVTSDAPDASARIARFAHGHGRWLVSVLMVSEGVDVPRLRVGVYATTARTELFFRQVVGRFIRRTPAPREQMSHLFLPSDPRLKLLAAEVEEERRHALKLETPDDLGAEPVLRERSELAEPAFRALWSSARRDDDVLQTTQPGEQIGLFGAAPPAPAVATVAAPSRPVQETAYEQRERLRAERRDLVSALARLTREPHRDIHSRVNRASGAATIAKATVAQLERGNAILGRELVRRRRAA